MTTREHRINRRLTRDFIDKTAPVCIVLIPYKRVDDDQGGWRYVRQAQRFDQTFRLIEQNAAGTMDQLSSDGVMRTVEFEMVGDQCAELELFDRFQFNGYEYEITMVWPNNGYETRASVVRRAHSN